MNCRTVLLGAMVAFALSGAHADVFRCTGSDGKTVYQETPCATGVQKPIDDRDSRQRERVAQERKADEERQHKRTVELRQQWATCQAKNNCVDYCYIQGESLATVYLGSFRSMAESGVMASDLMRQGCEKQVGELSADCVRQCESGFKRKARSVIK